MRAGENRLAPPAFDAPEVVAALEEYLAAIEAGVRLDRQAFLARHGNLAAALEACLDGLDALHESGR